MRRVHYAALRLPRRWSVAFAHPCVYEHNRRLSAREQAGTELRQLYGRVLRVAAPRCVSENGKEEDKSHGKERAWTRVVATSRNQYCAASRRTVGAAAPIFGGSAVICTQTWRQARRRIQSPGGPYGPAIHRYYSEVSG
ncbi:hypothetical protein KCP69_20840 [Salmonella enterica subsp. enterica]|nr:hypothetical protein KCP69_20840 [Salmonella enterica subsp. enterica]